MRLRLKLGSKGNATLLSVTGEITDADVGVLKAGLTKLLGAGKSKVIVDLSETVKIATAAKTVIAGLGPSVTVVEPDSEADRENLSKLEDKLADLMRGEAYTLRLRNRRLRFHVRLLTRHLREMKKPGKVTGDEPWNKKHLKSEQAAFELLKTKLRIE